MGIKAKHIEVFLEFLIFGIIAGVIEDVVAVKFATGHNITWEIIGIVILVTIPFAIISEIIVDRIDFLKFFKKKKGRQ
jgi:hypothetical protein